MAGYVFHVRSKSGGAPRTSDLSAELTSEQLRRVEKYRKEVDGNNEFTLLSVTGYIAPEQVLSYVCMGNCVKSGENPPTVDVQVRLKEDSSVDALVSYYCSDCRINVLWDVVYGDDLIKEIPAGVISHDDTGDYKTPTPESIEEVLFGLNFKDAQLGLDSFEADDVNSKLSMALRWAQKIGYDWNSLPSDFRSDFNAFLDGYSPELGDHISHYQGRIEEHKRLLAKRVAQKEIADKLTECLNPKPSPYIVL